MQTISIPYLIMIIIIIIIIIIITNALYTIVHSAKAGGVGNGHFCIVANGYFKP